MSADLRSVHWREIHAYINPMRRLVHDKLGYCGPATAKELAEYMDRDKCSVRPRLVELRDLGLIRETGERRHGEHVWAYVSMQDAERTRREQAESEARKSATQMALFA